MVAVDTNGDVAIDTDKLINIVKADFALLEIWAICCLLTIKCKANNQFIKQE